MFNTDWLKFARALAPTILLPEKIIEQQKKSTRPPQKSTNRKIRLQAGDVIRESRIIYDHYGVYVGDLKVIHFTDGEVRETSLKNFCTMPSQRISIMGFKPSLIRGVNRKKCVERANKAVGMNNYDLIQHNCEHFATWCRTNKAFSSQATTLGKNEKFRHTAALGSLTGFLTEQFAKEYGMQEKMSVRLSRCI